MEVEDAIEPVSIKVIEQPGLSPDKRVKGFSLPLDKKEDEDKFEDDDDENAPEETDRETLELPATSGT